MKHSIVLLAALLFAVAAVPALDAADEKKKKPKRKPNPAMQPIEDVAGLPRVLLIGDSISIGYTIPVRELMKGKANVHRPPTNCGPTTTGVKGIDAWLGDGKWDVIHFNWGLHDLKYMGPNGENLADPEAADSHQQVPAAEYEKNLRALVERLEKTDAKLIWRNTTPVPPGAAGRVAGDSVKYNEIAAVVMKEHGIPTNDLFTLSKERMEELMLPRNVHYKPEGSEALAAEVVKSIESALAE